MSVDKPRPSSQPPFWDERYAENEYLFGREPNGFIVQEADRIPKGASVVEFGAGEGRTLFWLSDERRITGTAVDFSAEALRTARRWRQNGEYSVETVKADVRSWQPSREWDIAVVTFLQLLPEERLGLYHTIRRCVRPGGLILGEWFRPDHRSGDYDRLGPSATDRMVPVDELRNAFSDDEILHCAPADVELSEGPLLKGSAAVVRLVARRSED